MMIHLQMLIKQGEKLVESWKDTPIGTDVIVTMDDGQEIRTKTRSEAQMMGGHSPVIWLDGISGAYSLRRVRKV